MITDSDLEKLADFGKEENGEYCDRNQFSIFPRNKERTHWELRLFCEVDGVTFHVKYLKDIDDLKNVYHAISNSELVFYKYFSTDNKKFIEEEDYILHQSELDGGITKCDKCYKGTTYVNSDSIEDLDEKMIIRIYRKSVKIKCVSCNGVGYFKNSV
jgi:hypothetical protein